MRLETTISLWGLVVEASVSAPSNFSISVTPGIVAKFHNQWEIQSPSRYVVVNWGQLTVYANNAYKLGIDNTVWVNNSGYFDPYHI